MSQPIASNGQIVASCVTEPVELRRRRPRRPQRSARVESIVRSMTTRATARRVEARATWDCQDILTITNPDGEVELEIVLDAKGPILRFRQAGLDLQCDGRVRFDCEHFQVHASESIEQVTAGELQQTARSVSIEATHGDVTARANDDVKLNGERLMLNC